MLSYPILENICGEEPHISACPARQRSTIEETSLESGGNLRNSPICVTEVLSWQVSSEEMETLLP